MARGCKFLAPLGHLAQCVISITLCNACPAALGAIHLQWCARICNTPLRSPSLGTHARTKSGVCGESRFREDLPGGSPTSTLPQREDHLRGMQPKSRDMFLIRYEKHAAELLYLLQHVAMWNSLLSDRSSKDRVAPSPARLTYRSQVAKAPIPNGSLHFFRVRPPGCDR